MRDVLARLAIWLRPPRQGGCATCRYFESDPERIEAMLPGLNVLGSAYASVAADDGLCLRHDTYQSSRCRCADHASRSGPDGTVIDAS